MSQKLKRMVSFFLGMLCVCTVTAILALTVVRNRIVEDQENFVHALAESLLPALLADDTQQVETILKTLERYPGVESAELISAQGVPIANYARDSQLMDSLSGSFELAAIEDDANVLHLMAPLTFDSLIVANLHIAMNLLPTYLRIAKWIGATLFMAMMIYVVIKKSRIHLRFERASMGGRSGRSDDAFFVRDAVSAAMKNAHVSLDFQPIHRLSDAGLFGMEVFVCFSLSSGQTQHVSPAEFCDLIQETGVVLPFDDWLFVSALSHAAEWQRLYGPLVLTLDLSATQFSDINFAKKIRAICAQVQYPHQLIELEIAEAIVCQFSEKQAALCVQSMIDQGFGVTMDGFGSSQQSIDLLSCLPLQKVKLNPGFLKRMKIDGEVHQWMKHCITQALGKDVQVMAQGLEAIDQYEAVKGLGCILGQGGFFHMPMNASSFERLLASYSMGQSHQRPVYLGGHGCNLSTG